MHHTSADDAGCTVLAVAGGSWCLCYVQKVPLPGVPAPAVLHSALVHLLQRKGLDVDASVSAKSHSAQPLSRILSSTLMLLLQDRGCHVGVPLSAYKPNST